MIYYIDIDETICFYPKTYSLDDVKDYRLAMPKMSYIAKINSLFDRGHTVVYWTSRGSRSGKGWFEFTENQLKDWGAKYTELRCDKPYYDVFVDDRTLNSIDYL